MLGVPMLCYHTYDKGFMFALETVQSKYGLAIAQKTQMIV